MPVQETRKDFRGVRLLIFDLDGTLIDSKLDLALSVNAVRAWLGRPPLEPERIYSYIGQGAPMLIRRALEEGVSEEEVERGLKYFLEYYQAHMLDHTVPYPGVREGLERLAQRPNTLLTVYTNKPERFSRQILEGLDLARFFRQVYGGNRFERKKPDPMGVEALLHEFQCAPQEAMMVGDSEIDVLTARNAGIWCAGVTYGLGAERLREYPPDLLLESLLELPARLDGCT